jgi:hypothetical protein
MRDIDECLFQFPWTTSILNSFSILLHNWAGKIALRAKRTTGEKVAKAASFG